MSRSVRIAYLSVIVAATCLGCIACWSAAPRSAQPDHTDHATPATVARLAQPEVPPPLGRRPPTLVHVELETRQVVASLADGVPYSFWTFNGTVPGPMIRVRQGDTVELTLKNAPNSGFVHSINLHAAHAPGGGSVDTQVAPGTSSTIRFEATNPGVFVYHCMTPAVDQHVANGMYGMVVVEPADGLPAVDHEWYVMQGDFYLQSAPDKDGTYAVDLGKLRDERPDYIVFNGAVGALSGVNALQARVGDHVRIFFGVGGPNRDSSFHVVGGLFDRVYPEGATEPESNVQTTLVPPGGATMVELTMSVPGHFMIEDHHISRLHRGAMADIDVAGEAQPAVFQAVARQP